MTEAVGGMPLLSGPPPAGVNFDTRADMSCRKCNKEFNMIFARGRSCNHCGYMYCHSCSDYQALMPRAGNESGYDPVPVCAFCIQFLTITAGGKAYLRSQPIAKLKSYIQAYGLRLGADVIEKDDVINAIVSARLRNGCLPPSNEAFYRQHAVPNGQTSRPRGLFNRPERTRQPPRSNIDPSSPWTQSNNFARPDIQPDEPPQPPPRPRQQPQTRPHAPPMPPHPNQSNGSFERNNNQDRNRPVPPVPPSPASRTYDDRNPPPPYNSRTHYAHENERQQTFQSESSWSSYFSPPQNESGDRNQSQRDTRYSYQPRERTSTSPNLPPRPTSYAAPAPPPPPPPRPVPSLDELLNMTGDEISNLSVSNLKAILFQNHVLARQILEKSELVSKVTRFIENEREERARSQAIHMQEEWEARERERERERAEQERERLRREAREEELRRQRREAYRASVESDSGSEGGVDSSLGGGLPSDGTPLMRPRTPPASGPLQADADLVSAQTSSSSAASPNTSLPPRSPNQAPPPKPPSVASSAERNGLCVVCQDEESNIVIVDCGHLALCRTCADLIMASTRECPLCRIRIVTESRLLRVFKA